MNANNIFFIKLAANKVIAKLISTGMNEQQAAEIITRPGHVAEILNLAEHLHIQAIDHLFPVAA